MKGNTMVHLEQSDNDKGKRQIGLLKGITAAL